ncbi:di-heme oxidoredictase family protein [Yoonia sp. BS5-3]|uniref:Di-heme oxidoredictase family protein n=1 Tax=Yoonia phaeophyticola TaxID=3137369 RepID=A0ABZ2UZT5_9RHOB
MTSVKTMTPIFALSLVFAMPVWAEDLLEPVDQADLNALVQEGQMLDAFLDAFEAGDALTETQFTQQQGVGANIGEGRIFTRFPRADLDGPTEWANHYPQREGGANAISCIACHNAPFANGAGGIALNVVVDPAHTGDPSLYLERNTLPLFALGVTQRLAEEISEALFAQREAARSEACQNGSAAVGLSAKGVSYGTLFVTRIAAAPCEVAFDYSALKGVDEDLVVRAFGWKGNHATIREFTRNAAHNELGLQAVELVGDQDGDYDGVIDELSVGDMTALTIYMAGLERPVSSVELADLGLIDLSPAARARITAGEAHFVQVGCATCHTPEMTLNDPIFSEPSTVPGFYDASFPDGSWPAEHGLAPQTAIRFDLAGDQPNNVIATTDGEVHLGALQRNADGQAVAQWYTDFRRHDIGAAMADPADPLGIGAAMFLTRPLAGVGATGPWLHDGRATTLHDAMMLHGGDAKLSQEAYAALSKEHQQELIAFLESLTLYQDPHADED